MKLPRHSSGYTIVEVMIVLAISAALFATAVMGYASQNRRTAFNQTVKDLELKIQDTLNDVGTGYFPNSGNFTCSRTSSPAAPTVAAGANQQGTNQDCIFVGKALDLTSEAGDNSFEIYTIMGLKNSSTDPEVLASSVEDTANRTIAGIPGAVESYTVNGSIDITKTLIGDGSTTDQSKGFAVVSGFGGGALGGSGATTNQVSIASIDTAYNYGSSSALAVRSSDLNKTMTICIEEGGGGSNARHATIKIGMGSKISVESNIDDWPAGCA